MKEEIKYSKSDLLSPSQMNYDDELEDSLKMTEIVAHLFKAYPHKNNGHFILKEDQHHLQILGELWLPAWVKVREIRLAVDVKLIEGVRRGATPNR